MKYKILIYIHIQYSHLQVRIFYAFTCSTLIFGDDVNIHIANKIWKKPNYFTGMKHKIIKVLPF